MLGFESLKDFLDVLLVPAIGGTIALLWPKIQAHNTARRFERLIRRELEELGPYPEARDANQKAWFQHQTRSFIHQRIFADASEIEISFLPWTPLWLTKFPNFGTVFGGRIPSSGFTTWALSAGVTAATCKSNMSDGRR